MAKKLIRVDSDLCTGCESCVLSCSFEKEGLYSFPLARIHIEQDEEEAEFTPRLCQLDKCGGQPCIDVCPTDALTLNKELLYVEWHPDRCIHCHLCKEACPFDAISFKEDSDELLVCDRCGGDPECVKACQVPGALRYEEV